MEKSLLDKISVEAAVEYALSNRERLVELVQAASADGGKETDFTELNFKEGILEAASDILKLIVVEAQKPEAEPEAEPAKKPADAKKPTNAPKPYAVARLKQFASQGERTGWAHPVSHLSNEQELPTLWVSRAPWDRGVQQLHDDSSTNSWGAALADSPEVSEIHCASDRMFCIVSHLHLQFTSPLFCFCF
jgi:hypothetical protein